jgi:hypothetical protein
LFTIETITLLELKIFNATIFDAKVGLKDFTFNFPHFERQTQVDDTRTHQSLRIRYYMLNIIGGSLGKTLQFGNY